MTESVKERCRPGVVRVVSRHRVTLPKAALKAAGIMPGDELRVEADGSGRLVIVRTENPG